MRGSKTFSGMLDEHFVYRNTRTNEIYITAVPQNYYEFERVAPIYVATNYMHGVPFEYMFRFGNYVVHETFTRGGAKRGRYTVSFNDKNGCREIISEDKIRSANRLAYHLDKYFPAYHPYDHVKIRRWLDLATEARTKSPKPKAFRQFLETHNLPTPYTTIGVCRGSKPNGRHRS